MLEPMDDRLVIEQTSVKGDTKSEGGIIMPEMTREKPAEGRVLAVGPGRRGDDGKRLPMQIEVGDKVLYGKYSGTEVTHDGRAVLIVREADILARIAR